MGLRLPTGILNRPTWTPNGSADAHHIAGGNKPLLYRRREQVIAGGNKPLFASTASANTK
jgi:hypothetical protein